VGLCAFEREEDREREREREDGMPPEHEVGGVFLRFVGQSAQSGCGGRKLIEAANKSQPQSQMMSLALSGDKERVETRT